MKFSCRTIVWSFKLVHHQSKSVLEDFVCSWTFNTSLSMKWSASGSVAVTLSCLWLLSVEWFADHVKLGVMTDKEKRISTEPLLLILFILAGFGTLYLEIVIFRCWVVKLAAITEAGHINSTFILYDWEKFSSFLNVNSNVLLAEISMLFTCAI